MPQQLTGRALAAHDRRRRAGLTLVEVLVSIVILGLVGAAITSVLTRQQRFYRDASETVEVRRELRGSASLIPVDLRSLSTVGGDLLLAEPTRFEIRAAIGSAVICGRSGSRDIDLAPLGLANHTLTFWHTAPVAGDLAFVFDESTGTGAEDDDWVASSVESASESVLYCVTTPFAHTAGDALRPRVRLRLTSDLPATVQVGAVVRLARPVRYTFYQPSGSANWYLGFAEQRSGVWNAEQPIAGPLAAARGARFFYYDTLGTALTPTTETLRQQVSRIDVRLQAVGRSDAQRVRGGQPFQDSLFFRVGIRNFK